MERTEYVLSRERVRAVPRLEEILLNQWRILAVMVEKKVLFTDNGDRICWNLIFNGLQFQGSVVLKRMGGFKNGYLHRESETGTGGVIINCLGLETLDGQSVNHARIAQEIATLLNLKRQEGEAPQPAGS